MIGPSVLEVAKYRLESTIKEIEMCLRYDSAAALMPIDPNEKFEPIKAPYSLMIEGLEGVLALLKDAS